MSTENPKGVFGMVADPKGEEAWLKHPVTTTGETAPPPLIPFPKTKIPSGNAISDAFRVAYAEKSEPTKKTLRERLAGVLRSRILHIGLAGVVTAGAGVAINEIYPNVPAVHQSIDKALERFGLKVVVPPVFDNKAEATVLGRNNSFYVTPEEYKEKGPPTVEEISKKEENITIPFPIRFNDGREHIVSITQKNGGFEVSGDIQGGELLVPAKEDGEIRGGGGSEGMPYLYKPGMSYSRFSSWGISVPDGRGGKVAFIITTGALQTAKDLDLQQKQIPKSFTISGHIKGFASIGTLLDNQPVFIAANIITPDGKFDLTPGRTYIPAAPTGQAYVLK